MKIIMHIVQAPGGVERYLYTLFSNMDQTKYRNILVCSQSYNIDKFKNLADKIEIVEMYREINLLIGLRAIVQIRKLIKKYRPDIVYMHSSIAGAFGRIANLGIHNISIYNAHGWAFNMGCSNKKKMIYTWMERLSAPFCTNIVAISDFEKKSAVEKKICKPEKIKVIFNGIDFKEYENVNPVKRKEIGIPDNAFVVGAVGRLTVQKAPDTFVKTAKLIKEKIPNAFFLMVGDGEQKKETESMIKSYGLVDSFKITGWVDNPIDYISIFDVAMLLSRWEGFGLVLAEYMISNKPIVATRADAIPDIIQDGKNGLLVNIDDYEGAAEKVINLFLNDEERKILVQYEKDTVIRRFDIKRVVAEHELIFGD